NVSVEGLNQNLASDAELGSDLVLSLQPDNDRRVETRPHQTAVNHHRLDRSQLVETSTSLGVSQDNVIFCLRSRFCLSRFCLSIGGHRGKSKHQCARGKGATYEPFNYAVLHRNLLSISSYSTTAAAVESIMLTPFQHAA